MKKKLEAAKVSVIYLEYPMAHATTILAMAKPLRGLGSTFVDVRAALEKLGLLNARNEVREFQPPSACIGKELNEHRGQHIGGDIVLLSLERGALPMR